MIEFAPSEGQFWFKKKSIFSYLPRLSWSITCHYSPKKMQKVHKHQVVLYQITSLPEVKVVNSRRVLSILFHFQDNILFWSKISEGILNLVKIWGTVIWFIHFENGTNSEHLGINPHVGLKKSIRLCLTFMKMGRYWKYFLRFSHLCIAEFSFVAQRTAQMIERNCRTGNFLWPCFAKCLIYAWQTAEEESSARENTT